MAVKKRGLGRGLEALLGAANQQKQTESPKLIEEEIVPAKLKDGELRHISIDLIQPGVYQPRKDMHPTALEELADSIKAQGIVQPIVIRPLLKNVNEEQIYEIIAGERRWRASQMAGLDKIPAVIREISDKATIAMALIENIQREDLNPIEEAGAIRRLITEFNMTHQLAAEAVGRSRTAVSNMLRLLELGKETRVLLENGDLEMGHARALLSLEAGQQYELAQQVISKELSVRDTEKLVKRSQQQKTTKPVYEVEPNIESIQNNLSEKLGAKVLFKHTAKGKGKMTVEYNSLDELEGILARIK